MTTRERCVLALLPIFMSYSPSFFPYSSTFIIFVAGADSENGNGDDAVERNGAAKSDRVVVYRGVEGSDGGPRSLACSHKNDVMVM